MPLLDEKIYNDFKNAVQNQDEESMKRFVENITQPLMTHVQYRQDMLTIQEEVRDVNIEIQDIKKDIREITNRLDNNTLELRELRIEMQKDSERSDERFASMKRESDANFENIQKEMHLRFDKTDERFASMKRESDLKFEGMQLQIDKRFDETNKRINTMMWIVTVGFVVLGSLLTVFRIFD